MRRIALSLAVVGLGMSGTAVAWAGPIFGLKSYYDYTVPRPSSPPTHLFQFETDGSAFTDLGPVRLSGGPQGQQQLHAGEQQDLEFEFFHGIQGLQ